MSSTPADPLSMFISSDISIANSSMVSLTGNDSEIMDFDYNEEEDLSVMNVPLIPSWMNEPAF